MLTSGMLWSRLRHWPTDMNNVSLRLWSFKWQQVIELALLDVHLSRCVMVCRLLWLGLFQQCAPRQSLAQGGFNEWLSTRKWTVSGLTCSPYHVTVNAFAALNRHPFRTSATSGAACIAGKSRTLAFVLTQVVPGRFCGFRGMVNFEVPIFFNRPQLSLFGLAISSLILGGCRGLGQKEKRCRCVVVLTHTFFGVDFLHSLLAPMNYINHQSWVLQSFMVGRLSPQMMATHWSPFNQVLRTRSNQIVDGRRGRPLAVVGEGDALLMPGFWMRDLDPYLSSVYLY